MAGEPVSRVADHAEEHDYCHACGGPLHGLSLSHDGKLYCCEGCLLMQQRFRAVEDERDNAYLAMAEALAAALDAREHETGLHSKRVACHTLVLARHFTDEPGRLQQIYWGALLHDLGKVGIPDAILLKPGSLTEDEWRVMRVHPAIGHRILSATPFLTEAADIVLAHEERFDGGGYPRGLAGGAIPLGARLFSVIDALDAMVSDRPYRKGMPFDAAKAEILRVAGAQFDPAVVDAFLLEEQTLREMVDQMCMLAGQPGTGSRVDNRPVPRTGMDRGEGDT